MSRPSSRLDFYSRSPAVQLAGETFIHNNPGVLRYCQPNETPGALYIRTLAFFADPSQTRQQAEVLGLRAGASRAEIVGSFSRALDGIMTPSEVTGALAAARTAHDADALYDRMDRNESDAARFRNGGKDVSREATPRKPDEEDVRRADILAAIKQRGGGIETGDRSNGRHRTDSSLATDIALSLFQHGATDRKIELTSPGAQAWMKEGSEADRFAALHDVVQDRGISDEGRSIRDWAVPDEDEDQQREVTND